MIKIAIIDDEEQMLQIIRDEIVNVDNLADAIKVHTYRSAQEFLEQTDCIKEYQIVFSDIEMDHLNGIEFGKVMMEKFPETYLIFITAYPDFAAQSYEVAAYQYILKSRMKDRLPQILRQVVEKVVNERQEYKLIGNGNQRGKIFLKDIVYIEKVKGTKYVLYHTISGEYKERNSLENIIHEIDKKDFIIVERGCVVNIQHIVQLKGNKIFLSNGKVMPIGRSRFEEVKQLIHASWAEEVLEGHK